MLICIFPFCAYVLFILYNIFIYLTSPFIYFIIYRKHKTPNNTLSKLKRTQAQNRFSRICISNRLARRLSAPILSTSTTIPCASMHRSPMQSTFIPCNPMHHTSMHHSAMHHSSMNSTPRHPRSRQERPELFCECPNTSADRFYRFFEVKKCILSLAL